MAKPVPVPAFITLRKAAQRVGVTPRTLLKLVEADKFPAPVRIGGKRCVPSGPFDDWVAKKLEASARG
jgi:excisionase family DNA binding protein